MQNLWMKPQWLYHIEKKPMNPNADFKASGDPTDPAKWSTADVAQAACERFGGTGLGIAFGDGLAGIDIDAHGIPKNPLQDEILDMFAGTYIECSPSGKGRHILFYVDYGTLNDRGYINDELELVGYANKKPKLDIETYITKRYFTWTGTADEEHFTTYDVNDMTEQYMAFLDKYMRDEKPTYQAPTQQYHVELDMTTEEILNKARTHANGAKFIALYDNGDLSAYGNDHSAADLALCNMLAWYLGKDADRIDAAFQDSALMRDKWLEKHGKQTYGEMTIAAAIEGTQGQYDPFGDEKGVTMHTNGENPVESLSEPQRGIRNKPIFDLDALRSYLDEKGIVVRFNDITQRTHVEGFDPNISQADVMAALPSHIYGDLARRYKRVTTGNIREFIDALAMDRRNHFNPVVDYLKGKTLDTSRDHLADLYAIMGLEDDWLSQALVKKWFVQGLALLHNDPDHPFQPEGVLTLAGEQGIGKTTFFSVMACKPEFFRGGQSINSRDKDNERRVVTTWIAELGELDCTFKSDIGKVKQFITNEYDEYRLPYGHTDKHAPRRTNMGATVNGDKFLIDETGNRRFWTIPLTNVDVDALRKFDASQVWLQVWESEGMADMDIEALSASFRLTPKEFDALKVRNGLCEKPMRGEDAVRDLIAIAEADPSSYTKRVTASQYREHYLDTLRNYSETEIGKVLNKLGYKTKMLTVDGQRGRFREVPWV